MTHERTLQTLKWALLLSVLVGVAWGSLGCGQLTAPTDVNNPREVLIETYTKCFGTYHKIGKVDVRFQDERLMVPCSTWAALGPDLQLLRRPDTEEDTFRSSSGDDDEEMCVAAGWTSPYSGLVTYWRPWVHQETSDYNLADVAGHEVCHLTGLWNERLTSACNRKHFWGSGCFR